MNSKQLSETIKVIIMASVFMIGGCAETMVTRDKVYIPTCYEKSNYFNLEFSFPCKERNKAQVASAICDLMGASAHSLIDTNRRIGPTTAEDLFLTSGVENLPTIKVLNEVLGEESAKAYINDIWDMSVYISQRNITDLTAYPKERFNSCLGKFNYRAER